MSTHDELNISQSELVNAWQKSLPEVMPDTDQVMVTADAADEHAFLVTVQAAGRTKYNFDFRVKYVDSREIDVSFVDVEVDHRSVDEHDDTIQQLIHDYTRHIHECAQLLHAVTHA